MLMGLCVAGRAGMASAGFKVRGAYHFGHPNSDAAAQAHHFVSAVGATQTHADVALFVPRAMLCAKSCCSVTVW